MQLSSYKFLIKLQVTNLLTRKKADQIAIPKGYETTLWLSAKRIRDAVEKSSRLEVTFIDKLRPLHPPAFNNPQRI